MATGTLKFGRTDLFGGGMTVNLPDNYLDASKLRQIPDNQEVYLCKDGLTSILFDITERVDEPSVDEAIRYHLEDIVEKGDGIKVWSSSHTSMAKLPSQNPTSTLLATTHPSFANNSNSPQFTALLLILVRLPAQRADIVVTINIPHVSGEYDASEINLEEGHPGHLIQEGMAIRDQILGSLEVQKWDLFGNSS
ncbi:MAG: multicopy suppressor of ts gsp1 [Icmadophila ericetorum]|nr:multicopy suppressor of ts gsp1 [Icmadophila ericetorum]